MGLGPVENLGLDDEARRLMNAVERVCADGIMTPDVGGDATTEEVTQAVVNAIRGAND